MATRSTTLTRTPADMTLSSELGLQEQTGYTIQVQGSGTVRGAITSGDAPDKMTADAKDFTIGEEEIFVKYNTDEKFWLWVDGATRPGVVAVVDQII